MKLLASAAALLLAAWYFGAYQSPLNPEPPFPGRLYALPCVYGVASRVCVFERAEEARYSEATP